MTTAWQHDVLTHTQLKTLLQWTEARPRQVAWLRQKGHLEAALQQMVQAWEERIGCEEWEEQRQESGLSTFEAEVETAERLLHLPTETEQPVLAERLAPYGQPKMAPHPRQRACDAQPRGGRTWRWRWPW